jgi:hypothetical protein
VRDLDNGNVVLGRRLQGALYGKHPPRIGYDLLQPRLLLTSVDSFPLNGPFLATCTNGCIDTIASTGQTNFGVINNFDAQWLDAATPGTSWLLRGRKMDGWWLQNINPGGPCGGNPASITEWQIDSPPDQYGLKGRLAFMGHVNDAWNNDLILATRFATRDGLVAFSRSQLVQSALANPAGSNLGCVTTPPACPVFAVDVHPEFTGWTAPGCGGVFPCGLVTSHFAGRVFNLDCDTFQEQVGGRDRRGLPQPRPQ